MGIIKAKEQDYDLAAEDWLVAAHCFILASRPQLAHRLLGWVEQVRNEGKLSQNRKDLFTALSKRADECRSLEKRVAEFTRFGRQLRDQASDSQEILDALLGWRRELPGHSQLYALIILQALLIGDLALAESTLRWADRLFQGDHRFDALRIYFFFKQGRFDQAAKLGTEMLRRESSASLRYLVALSLVSGASGGLPFNLSSSLEILQPLIEDESNMSEWRLLALALASSVHHELNQKTDSEQKLFARQFERLTENDRNRFMRLFWFMNSPDSPPLIRDEIVSFNETLLFSDTREQNESNEESLLELGQLSQLAIAM
jgi:hypothetical protein